MELRERLQATLGSAYTLERELQGGGMSRVFAAEETRFGRKVVVKVLNPELAAGLSADRFEREIRVAAQLNDPRIVAVLSAGEAGGVPYYTMPFVEGESLRERLRRSPVPLAEAVSILRDIALALECAHGRGVVHRDIKPENVLLNGRTAMVTDFGIAKALNVSRTTTGDATLTQLGMALGTPAYLAPEQAVGDVVDHRADLYAWGVVAYELLAGAHPFPGRHAQALIAAHLTVAPPPLAAARADLPPALVSLVHRCLAKAPEHRPANVRAVLAALDDAIGEMTPARGTPIREGMTPSRAAALAARPSVAVLPFANLSPDEAQGFLADGITDELITDLSAIRAIRVIARGSAMRFKDAARDPVVVARELGVRFILEGSVKHTPEALRITTRLVDATDGSAVWSDKMSGALSDVFAMQERLSRSIVDALEIVLAPDEERRLAARPIGDLRAYESYLRARHEMWSFTVSGYERAQQLLQNALAIVGENAVLYAALGQLCTLRVEGSPPAQAEACVQEAERCARIVSELEPDSAHANRLWGFIHVRRGAVHEAARSFERARDLDPNNPDVLLQLTYVYVLLGREDDARRMADEALAVDPLTPVVHCMPGLCEFMTGHPERALPYYRKFLAMDPGSPAAHCFLIWVLGHTRFSGEIAALTHEVQRRFAGAPITALTWCYTHALAGNAEAARAALTPELEAAASSTEFFARGLADCYAIMGDAERAIDALEHAVRLGLWNYPYLARHDRHLERLRPHPRFRALLDRVRSAWETGQLPSAPVPAPSTVSVVAVLPFTSMSPDPDNAFFADGLTEEIIVDLSRLKALRVTSRNSAMRYKGSAKDTKTIGRELGARYLLEGSVRRAGPSLRVTSQLVEAETDTQLWSERFNGSLDDVFEIQEQIARRIADTLEVRLSPEDERRLGARAIKDVHAFELYLRARQLTLQFTEPALASAMALVDRAIAMEGERAVLLALKGSLLHNLVSIGARAPEVLADASAYVDRALAAEPDLAQALVSRALIEINAPRVDAALILRLLRRACDAEPHPEAHLWLAVYLAESGRPELGIPYGRRARELDPVTPIACAAEAFPLVFSGRGDAGLRISRSAVERDPHDAVTRYFHAVFCAACGELDEARSHFDAVKDSAWGTLAEMYRRAWGGDREGLFRLLDEPYLALHTEIDRESSWFAAQALTIVGEHDAAMRRLRHAAKRGFVNTRFVSTMDRLLAPLRTHPEFPELLAYMDRRAEEIARESGFST
jgi:TolB-like protein/tRNA A-37 threonylcarbamoyl transferase component Bud32/Tfp pilus assembly protein PilF